MSDGQGARAEIVGGVVLLAAAVVALVWANSPWSAGYAGLRAVELGPLDLQHWAGDGLLAIFFFVVGVELKHELVAGSLREPREAAVPALAAVGGMVVPALVFVGVVLARGETDALHGWAIPAATDIAFALAVLAVFGRGLPPALRTFLLTLAVVDDLLAIIVIAVFYTAAIQILWLLGAVAAVAVFAVLIRMRRPLWWLLVPVALVAWFAMHESGVHATIAGVLLGLVVPGPLTTPLERRVRPLSTFVALPLFAFFAAGVPLASIDPAAPVVLAIVAALVLGKLVGVLGTTALVTRLTGLRLPDGIRMRDLLPIGLLTGIGFTVALLIADLSFDDGAHIDAARFAVLGGSLISAVLGGILLRWDARRR